MVNLVILVKRNPPACHVVASLAIPNSPCSSFRLDMFLSYYSTFPVFKSSFVVSSSDTSLGFLTFSNQYGAF